MAGMDFSTATGDAIAQHLHRHLAALIDGNHVKGSELLLTGQRSAPCELTYRVEWSFSSHTEEAVLAGNTAVSTHFGFDSAAYGQETAHRCTVGRTHQPLRQDFIARTLQAGGMALGKAETAITVWDFGQHSVHKNCNHCHGKGQVACSGCGGSGNTTCNYCHGIGSTTQTRWVPRHGGGGYNETYQQSCYHCGHSGRQRCASCAGGGRQRCNSCDGHGFFTAITSVTVRAKPSVHIDVRTALSASALLAFLLPWSVAQAVQHIAFTVQSHESTAAAWCVHYGAQIAVVESDFQLRGTHYLAATAQGTRAWVFVKPPLFDALFSEELAALQKIGARKKKRLNQQQARQFFATYAGQPVLDAAMQGVARLAPAARSLPGREVERACDGYITTACAQALGNHMLALLDKVSPPHSAGAWAGVLAIPLLLVFFWVQNLSEQWLPQSYWDAALMGLLLLVGGWAVVAAFSPIAASASAVVSALRRRSVPAPYRQAGRNWKPFKRFAWIGIGAAIAGAGMGVLTHQKILPRWNNAPLQYITHWEPLQSLLTPHQQTLLNALLLNPQATKPGPQEPTANTLVWDVQSNLKLLGYNTVAASGRMDTATQNAIAAYARKRRIQKSLETVQAAMCQELRQRCVNHSGSPR